LIEATEMSLYHCPTVRYSASINSQTDRRRSRQHLHQRVRARWNHATRLNQEKKLDSGSTLEGLPCGYIGPNDEQGVNYVAGTAKLQQMCLAMQ
jgi:hypothetical protein